MKKNLFLLSMGVCLLLTGCIERRVFVRTMPPDATLYFNDEVKGQTPADFDFKWYWTHNVRIEKKGYRTIEKEELIKSPPYLWVPLDFFMEILPFKIKDYHYLDYELEELSEEEKRKQAEKLEFLDKNKFLNKNEAE